MSVGAKDPIDRALVRQYATAQTNKFDEEKICPEDMWKNINMMAMSYKVHCDLKKTINIPRQTVALKGFWDK